MAEHADGSIIIDTELDSQGFKKGSDELQKALKSLGSKMDSLGPTFDKALKGNAKAIQTFESKVKGLESSIDEVKKKMANLAEERIPTKQYTELQKAVKQAENELDKLIHKQREQEKLGVSKNTQSWKKLQLEIEVAEQKLAKYDTQLQRLENKGNTHVLGVNTAQYAQLESELQRLTARLNEMKTAEKKAGKFTTFRKALSKIGSAAKGAGKKLLEFHKNSNRASNGLGGFGNKLKGITRMLKHMVLFRAFSVIMTAMSDGLKNLSQYSTQTNADLSALKSALTQLKNSFATAFAPILSAVTPVLTTLINYLSAAITYVGKFVAALTGAKTFTKATAVQEDYAASLGNTADAAKEAEKQLMGFDKINKLNDDSSSGSGGGSGPDVSEMFEEVPIESGIVDFAEQLKEGIEKGDFEGVGQLLAEKLNGVVQKINDAISWEAVGPKVTAFVDGFTRTFNSLVDNVDWTLIGDTVGEGINTVINTVNLIVTGIDWSDIGTAFSEGINGCFSAVDWNKVGETVSNSVKGILSTLNASISGMDWQSVGGAVSSALNNIDWPGIISQVSSSVSETLEGALELVTGFVKNLDWTKLGSDLWNSLVELITNIDWFGIVEKAFGFVSDTIKGGLQFVSGIVSAIRETLQNIDWTQVRTDLWNGIVEMLGSVDWLGIVEEAFKLIGNVISNGIKNFADLAAAVKDAIISCKDKFSESGGEILAGIFEGIKNAVSDIWQLAKDYIFTPIWEAICEVFGIASPAKAMEPLGGYIIDGLINGIGDVWSKIKQKFIDFYTGIKEWFLEKVENFKVMGSWIISGIKSGLGNIWETLYTKFKTFYDDIKAWFEKLKEKNFKVMGSWIISGIKSGLGNIWSTISSKFATFYTNLKNWFTNLKVSSLGSTLITNIKNGIGNIWTSLKTKFTTFWTDMKNWFAGKALKLKTTWDTTSTLGKALVNMGLKGMPKLSFFAKGGVVDGATLSVLGEAGKEAVVPLERNTGWMKVIAKLIAKEIATSTFSVQQIEISYDFDETMVNGIRSVSYEFLDRLEAIANSVTFTMPVVAEQGIPYAVAASVEAAPDIGSVIEASNDELAMVVTRAIASATVSIVGAIEKQGSNSSITDNSNVTNKVIQEINRITRITGKSPINNA